MQEKVEIITNHFEHYWTKIPKNGYCEAGKKEGKGKGNDKKVTKYPVAGSRIQTHDLMVTRRKP